MLYAGIVGVNAPHTQPRELIIGVADIETQSVVPVEEV
jgi:hypothetical protein